jgi:3'(2'), 5'-bisphosphate nucleotidase/myo-inositol-1(or 4)-monophosphatase
MTITLPDPVLRELADLAGQAALSAGQIIASRRRTGATVRHKQVGDSEASQIVTEVDHLAQDAILALLRPTCATFGLALLTEEAPDDGERLEKPAFWCIDPLDGTQAFVNDTPGFSVSIALVARDATPLIGIVYDPVERVLYRATRNQGAFRADRRMQLPKLDPRKPLTLRADFSFRQHRWLKETEIGLAEIANRLGLPGSVIEYRTGGVINACGVLADANCCYFKYPRAGASGGSLWDYAATACLFNEVSAFASDIMRNRMDLNREGSTFMNHRGLLFAADERVAQGIADLYARLAT